MRRIILIIALCFLAGCSYRSLEKGDLKFSAYALFEQNAIQGLTAESASGDTLSIDKRNADMQSEMLKAMLEALL